MKIQKIIKDNSKRLRRSRHKVEGQNESIPECFLDGPRYGEG